MYNHKNGITIRKISKNDLSILLKLKQESWWGTHTCPFLNENDQEQWFESLTSNTLVTVALKDENVAALAIISNIDWISRTAHISGSVIKAYREPQTIKDCCAAQIDFVFEMLNLNRIDAEVLDFNVPAQQLEIGYLKFQVEGKRRQAVYKCGKYYDSIVLGLLRVDWVQQERHLGYCGTCNTTFDHDVADKLRNRSKYLK